MIAFVENPAGLITKQIAKSAGELAVISLTIIKK
jgi:hypothetical protein